MDGRLYYDTRRNIVILWAEGIWGEIYVILVSKISLKLLFQCALNICEKYVWYII